jgi:peptide/nickel transport system permease protein
VRAGRHRAFVAGALVTFALVASAALSLVYTPADPLAMSISGRLERPTRAHPFGTDQYGRDVLSRVMAGATTSITVGVIAVGLGAMVGVALGALGGWLGGVPDEALMRVVDAMQGFPAVLSALLFGVVLGPGAAISMLAVGLAFVPAFARLTRASVLELRARDFVVAARALGASEARCMGRHVLPNTVAPLLVQATTSFPVAVLAEAGLAYLGLGTQPPHPSWGLMLKEAQNFLSLNPWLAVFPGGAIALTVLGLNLMGDAISSIRGSRERGEHRSIR